MKLFKNKVGRPSNEIKQKRKIFVISAAAIAISLLAIMVASASNLINLQGVALQKPANTAFDDMNFYKCVVDQYNKQTGKKASYNVKLTDNQLKSIGELSCNNRGIVSVKGIEKLINLREFEASSFDANHSLWNKIARINISQNKKLVHLTLMNNKLTNINLKQNKKLQNLQLDNNKLKALDLTNNKELYGLSLSTAVFKTLNLSKNVNLSWIYFQDMKLSNLNLSKNKKLKRVTITTSNNLQTLNLDKSSMIEELKLEDNYNLQNVYVNQKTDEMNKSKNGSIYYIKNCPKVKIIPVSSSSNVTASENKCYISSMSTAKGSRILKYKVKCNGDYAVSDTKYKIGNSKFITRKESGRKAMASEIIFKKERIGNNITLRVYYNNNKSYDEKTIKLGSGKVIKNENKNATKTTSKKLTTTNSGVVEPDEAGCYADILDSGKSNTKITYKIVCYKDAKLYYIEYKIGNGKFISLDKNKKEDVITFDKSSSGKTIIIKTYYKYNNNKNNGWIESSTTLGDWDSNSEDESYSCEDFPDEADCQ